MQKYIAVVAALLAGIAGSAAATTKPAPKWTKKKPVAASKPKAATHTAARKPTAKSSSTAHKAARTTRQSTVARSNPKQPAARAAWHPAQAAPTPERYKEFQQALIAKGYLHGEATGQWDETSADAMRRFQKDQNLTPTGKPNESLSIIALGLGPKH